MEPEYTRQFDAYLGGELSPSEREKFEKRLAEDREFREEFDFYSEVYAVLKNNFSDERKEFTETLKKVNAEFQYSEKEDSARSRVFHLKAWHYAIAASILLLIGLFVFQQNGIPDYSDYATQENISLTVRGEQNTVSKKAEENFNVGNYEEALPYLIELHEENPDNRMISYYLAVAQVETDRFEEADDLLSSLSKTESAYAEKAQWRLVLSKLKQKDYEAVKDLIKGISPESPYYKEAQQLLKKL